MSNKLNDLNWIQHSVFPNSFIRSSILTSQEKILFEILCAYDIISTNGERKGWCDPSLESVSIDMGIKKRAVQEHLKRLVRKGLVTIIYRNNIQDGDRSSLYVLNILPGISKNDRLRISQIRNIDIKNKLSGLHRIKVNTIYGMQYISNQEFDLEFIITGNRSSEILIGQIADPDDLDSADYPKITEKSESGKITSGPSTLKSKSKNLDFNNDDIIIRIENGNYEDVTSFDICQYFKYCYSKTYKEILLIDKSKDTNTIDDKLKELEIGFLIPLIKFFISNYSDSFYVEKYPRPKIYMLNQVWILNKLLENFYKYEEIKSESIQGQKSEIIKVMDF